MSQSRRILRPRRSLLVFGGISSAVLALATSGCGDGDPEPGTVTDPNATVIPGGTEVPSALADVDSAQSVEFAALRSELTAARQMDAPALLEAYPSEHLEALSYTPSEAEFLDLVQASPLALNDTELAVLDQRGFVVSKRQTFPSFLRGYASIYENHLPVYVSADAMLDALHRSYDKILEVVEYQLLRDELGSLLSTMLTTLPTTGASVEIQKEAELYLQVALGLLQGGAPAGSDPVVGEWIAKARAAEGFLVAELFGGSRMVDTSQFTPRGHYTEGLEGYFQSMIWLGRIDLRLIETQSDGSSVFHRNQYDMTLALAEAAGGTALANWHKLDDTVQAFVGESDNMTLPQVNAMVEAMGGMAAARAASDEQVLEVLTEAGYGTQQIASHLMVNDGTVPTLPLSRTFLLFGQRYVADSHVFSEVTYDRVGRMMPNPLDVAFAALGNNQGAHQNADELALVGGYPGALAGMRALIDSHDDSFWNANLYNLWNSALRGLSEPVGADPAALGLPQVTGTKAWGRRLLNTQLGSWAQLRHDTILYAKQSYSGIPGCDFPDAYIEPYPEFFGAIGRYATRGEQLLQSLQLGEGAGELASTYYASLRNAAETLGEMAAQQRDGIPHTADQLEFINNAVRIEAENAGCVTIDVPNGWYADLFFERAASIELDATIADVHTQPANEAGAIVGKVLHVGTGMPRVMTVTVDTCAGPRAYTGMAYAYHETVTEDFERLNDEDWSASLVDGVQPPDVPWAASFVSE